MRRWHHESYVLVHVEKIRTTALLGCVAAAFGVACALAAGNAKCIQVCAAVALRAIFDSEPAVAALAAEGGAFLQSHGCVCSALAG